MEIILRPGETLEVSFEWSEEVFEISSNIEEHRVKVVQTAGYELHLGSDLEPDEILIYQGDAQFVDTTAG
jgi:hypothetical protein